MYNPAEEISSVLLIKTLFSAKTYKNKKVSAFQCKNS